MKDVKVKILSNIKVGDSYYKMTLEAPYIAGHATPGQFVQVRCSDGIDPLLRRPFSIHRLKAGGSRLEAIEVLYEVIGRGTGILSGKKKGEYLDVLGPLGKGFTLPRASSRAVIIAGGIGVAPLVFLAEALKKKNIKTMVLIGAKTKSLVLCEQDFKGLGFETYIATDDGSCGSKGFVSKLFKPETGTMAYACGPNPMLKCIAGMCKKKRIDCEVSLEEKMACGIGACLGCSVKVKGGRNKLACKDGPVFEATDLLW